MSFVYDFNKLSIQEVKKEPKKEINWKEYIKSSKNKEGILLYTRVTPKPVYVFCSELLLFPFSKSKTESRNYSIIRQGSKEQKKILFTKHRFYIIANVFFEENRASFSIHLLGKARQKASIYFKNGTKSVKVKLILKLNQFGVSQVKRESKILVYDISVKHGWD